MEADWGAENNIILLCEDSPEGIFTGVYEAYALRLPHERIHLQTGAEEQPMLFADYREVKTDTDKAEKVIKTLKDRFVQEDYEAIWLALTAPSPERAQAVYGSIVWGLSNKRRGSVLQHLTDENIRRLMELSRGAGKELQHLKGFLRFEELENGLLSSVIRPKNAILPMLAEHFADRLPMENFLIYDEGRKYYAVHPAGKEWFLMQGEEQERKLHLSAEEEYYRELFRQFCHSISIDERKNLNLQRNMLPLRFRPYMTEFAEK
ncbi:MAG: TIGR03915 family putative DNA repair protein [Lachnospiraceae bacterium]|nr:TIGR03915 family putative DNA repair protein [Lachnospiraceae bacterium]